MDSHDKTLKIKNIQVLNLEYFYIWSSIKGKGFYYRRKIAENKKKKEKEGEVINIRMDLKVRVILGAGKELKRQEESHQMKYIFGKEGQGRK